MSRLSREESQIFKAEIQRLYATGRYSQREIANMFNKAPSQIARWTKDIEHENKTIIKKRSKYLFGK